MNRDELISLVMSGRGSLEGLVLSMPDAPTNDVQRIMAKSEGGTPRNFARAVVNAVGEITVLEAEVAIAAYLDKWNA